MFFLVLLLIVIQWIETSKVVDTRNITEKQGRDVVLACQFERLNQKDRIMW